MTPKYVVPHSGMIQNSMKPHAGYLSQKFSTFRNATMKFACNLELYHLRDLMTVVASKSRLDTIKVLQEMGLKPDPGHQLPPKAFGTQETSLTSKLCTFSSRQSLSVSACREGRSIEALDNFTRYKRIKLKSRVVTS